MENERLVARSMFTPIPDWSETQLDLTIPAAAGTLVLPNVAVVIPDGITIVKARAILASRVIYNSNVALNKLNGATVAATSQVIQIQKGAGAWSDAINFIDDELSQAGLIRDAGVCIPGTINLSAIITGSDTYSFRWLLARADLDSIILQDVKMAIQYSYLVYK
ncbi:MAG: hypothetical protein PHN44_00720 [Candidatus Marinimicrobia bacterium]|nr:hypothetical protein [Candidatus Neomarinimicrobiota bacterium]MDD5539111.1 hypothetical protein [Candidatus Neomarinimicrobiota bacterium]